MSPMATSLLSPFSATPVSNVDSVTSIGIPKTSFPHSSKFYFHPSTASTLAITARRWRFRLTMASEKDSIDHLPKQFREENLKEGQLDMFIGEHNSARRLAGSGPEGSISSHDNYLKHSGKGSVSGAVDGGMTGRRYTERSSPVSPVPPSSLLRQRIILLDCPIFPQVSEHIISQLMMLNCENQSKPIYLHIMSPGNEDEDEEPLGSETDSYAIADFMAICKSKIYTVNMGKACGPAAMLLSLGAKGRRCVLPCAYTTLYLPKVPRSSGRATEMCILREELDGNIETFLQLLSKGTGKSKQELHRDLKERHRRFNAQETIDYGLADRILWPKKARDRGYDESRDCQSNPQATAHSQT